MIVDAIESAWRAWAELGRALTDQQWSQPTRLGSWTVRDTYAHVTMFPPMIVQSAQWPSSSKPLTHATAGELLRDWNRPGGLAHQSAEHVAEAATQDERSTEELVKQFATVGPQAIQVLRTTDLTRPLDYAGATVLPQSEIGRIVVMESVVHYFDIAAALDLPRPGPLDDNPVRLTTQLLAEIADPVTLIEVATGRASASVFPLMR
ncbi:maleylpyruvate isomerase N-terminal domain-containing protein [Allosaccharopolyspora coralli]|uniref:maleylpyruvate isomerase N-terminal domain-containing protein n=1 Tax=Allosaccharopolyspora coralli TaxID=2665642 RepID=UPI001652397B|nr:maleylpyruvate isomerase N-terminal domain-containing protein [Allosaccharopolyspora coralli]